MPTEQQILTEFRKSVRNITDNVRFNALRDALYRGDYDAAVRAIDIDEAAFDGLRAMLVETYAEGGINEVSGMRFRPAVRWNGATPQAEEYARLARSHMSDLAADMRAAVSWQIGDSVAFGRSANRTALDLVGRVGANGVRQGGIVGLNDQRTKWVSSLRRALENGEPVQRDLLTETERRMIDRGGLSQEQIDKIVQAYSNRQLLSRGRAIAKTERGLAINSGAYAAWAQAAEKLGVPYTAIRKQWVHEGVHKHERWDHVALSRMGAIPLPMPFNVGGYNAQYPHDPNLPTGEVVNCQCRVKFSLDRNWRNGS